VLWDFGIDHKFLSVTCDNASNNDTMASELDKELMVFSPVNRTRCFAHILNLVAKSLLKQFDIKQDEKKDDDLDSDEQSLLAFAGDIRDKELAMAQENDDDNDSAKDDNLEGWVDKVQGLTAEE
jgi:hypothetical protein